MTDELEFFHGQWNTPAASLLHEDDHTASVAQTQKVIAAQKPVLKDTYSNFYNCFDQALWDKTGDKKLNDFKMGHAIFHFLTHERATKTIGPKGLGNLVDDFTRLSRTTPATHTDISLQSHGQTIYQAFESDSDLRKGLAKTTHEEIQAHLATAASVAGSCL